MERRAEPRALVALSVLLLSSLLIVAGARAQCPPPNQGGYFDSGPDTERWVGPFSHRWEYVPPGGTYPPGWEPGYTLPFPGGIYVASFQQSGYYGIGPLMYKLATPGGPSGCNFPTDYFPSAEFTNLAWYSLGATTCSYYAAQYPAEVGFVYCDPNACGNTIKEPWEECDDGNTDDGDTCNSDCQPNSISCAVSQDVIRVGTVVTVNATVQLLSPNSQLDPPNLRVATIPGGVTQPPFQDLDAEFIPSGDTSGRQFRFYAKDDFETVTGTLTGGHLNGASCTLTANTSIPLPAPNPEGECLGLGATGGVASVGAFVAGLACTLAEPCGVVGAVLGGIAVATGIGGTVACELEKDPPDPNYTTFAMPTFMSFSPIPTGQGVDQAAADAIGNLLETASQLRGYGRALLTTMNRATGAFVAGDAYWKQQQLRAAGPLRRALATLFVQTAAEQEVVKQALDASGFSPVTVSSEQIAIAQDDVRQHGLPAPLTQMLSDMGAEQDLIDDLKTRLLDADPASAQGTIPAAIADPAYLKGLLWQAALLGTPQKQLCYRAHPTAPIGVGGYSTPLELADEFGTVMATVRMTAIVHCSPVNTDGVNDDIAAPHDTVGHLTKYRVTPTTPPTLTTVTRHVENSYHELTLKVDLRKPAWLMAPSAVAIGTGGVVEEHSPFSDALLCYKVRLDRSSVAAYSAPGAGERYHNLLGGPIATRHSKPVVLCSPVSVNDSDPTAREHAGHLLCYKTREVRDGSTVLPEGVLSRKDWFVNGALKLTRADTFCVPTLVDAPTE